MAKYVALLRGIGPGMPNMRNEKLRGVFEDLGFKNVRPVISSGNILFESSLTNVKSMEDKLEKGWPTKLGFTSTTLIRSQQELEDLAKLNPFKDLEHGPSSYLMTTFLKSPSKIPFKLPYHPPDKPYYLISSADRVVFSVTDNSAIPTTDLMSWLEKQFGKQISSRTWLTVNRILKKLQET